MTAASARTPDYSPAVVW